MTDTPIAQLHTLPESATALLGRLIDPVELPAYETAIGFVFVQGAGLRVGMLSGDDIRQMSPTRARRFADELGATGLSDLRPVIAILREKADALDVLISKPKGSA